MRIRVEENRKAKKIMKSISKNELVRKISICGQVAEHKSEKVQERGLDEALILSPLTDGERAQLDALLTKLQTAWLEDHKRHHAAAARERKS